MAMFADTEIQSVLVVGLGRIGLPQSLSFANAGIKVYGFDRNPATTAALKRCETPFFEPDMDKSLKNTIDKNFFPISSWEELDTYIQEIDAVLFTVGTQAPNLHDAINDEPFDLTEYFLLLDKLFSNKTKLKKGVKLIIRTTLPLGATDKLKNYLETTHSLKEGEDFFLAFVPERITEGAALEEFKTVPKIIGVYSDAAFEPISQLFKRVGGKIIRVRNPITAEFCKLTDNSFRSTIFSFANEVAMHASEFDINAEEVINAVNDNYQRNHIPQPGFVSGYCLSKDPYIFELGFLKNKIKRDFQSLWYYGRRTNDYLIEFTVARVMLHLKNPEHSCVAILGLSFNNDIDDFRMSHSFKIMELLIENGVKQFNVYDPNLDKNIYTTLPDTITPYIAIKSSILDKRLFTDVDAIIICDKHQLMHEADNVSTLTALFENTKNPCYLFDGWVVWKEARKIAHINYEGIGFKQYKSSDIHKAVT
jgi:nucleotide sugar dehydrogenase